MPNFKKMSEFPKVSVDDESFSVLVLVYELHTETKEIISVDLGWYDFVDKSWNVMGDDSMDLYCWCVIPSPSKETEILATNYETTTHKGYR